jgi:hypothetical protein
MGNIHSIFDLQSDLDPLEDPNAVIHVQGLIKEMLGANEHRQLGIRREMIEDYGTFALTGVLSATYVLSKQLSNRKNQQLLAGLMRELAGDNPAAIRMLINTGVGENPFAESRSVVAGALAGMDTAAVVRELAPKLLKAAERAGKLNDQEAARQIYELLLQHGLGSGEALTTCREWFSGEYELDEAVKLLSSVLQRVPERTEDTLFDLFSLLDRKDSAKSSLQAYLNLPNTSALAPALRAADRLLTRERIARSKPVEALFEGAFARCILADPTTIANVFDELESNSFNDTVVRYWWQALSRAARQKNDEARHAFSDLLPNLDDEDSQLWGAVSLLFIASGHESDASTRSWANDVINDLELSIPDVLEDAREQKEKMRPQEIGPTRGPGGGGGTGVQ